MYKFEVGKTYKTRDGCEAVIYAYYPDQNRCYHGAVLDKTNIWVPHTWESGGLRWVSDAFESPLDLMPPENHVYINVYQKSNGYSIGRSSKTRQDADKIAGYSRVGCIKIKLEERFDD